MVPLSMDPDLYDEASNNEIGKPIVKDGGKKILANPFKFICEDDDYVL